VAVKNTDTNPRGGRGEERDVRHQPRWRSGGRGCREGRRGDVHRQRQPAGAAEKGIAGLTIGVVDTKGYRLIDLPEGSDINSTWRVVMAA
jgi:hypothetical protein